MLAQTRLCLALVVALVAGALAGCVAPFTAAPTPTPLPTNVYRQPRAGLAVALPTSWQWIDTDPLEPALEEASKQNPQFAPILNWEVPRLIGSGTNAVGVDLASDMLAKGYLPALNILTLSGTQATPRDELVQARLEQLVADPTIEQPVEHRDTTLPAGEATEIQYTAQQTTVDGKSAKMFILKYLLVQGRTSYEISMITLAEDKERYLPVFKQIAESFRLEP